MVGTGELVGVEVRVGVGDSVGVGVRVEARVGIAVGERAAVAARLTSATICEALSPPGTVLEGTGSAAVLVPQAASARSKNVRNSHLAELSMGLATRFIHQPFSSKDCNAPGSMVGAWQAKSRHT
jgi:hypothetical protein